MGVCACPNGFSGDSCEINNRDRVLGVYNAVTSSGSGYCNSSAFQITIEVSSYGSNYVTIKNFNGLGAEVFGTVGNSYPTITVPDQVFGSNSFFGQIDLQSNNLTGSFRVRRENPYGSCDGTLTRKP
jgi:hypothetical protein